MSTVRLEVSCPGCEKQFHVLGNEQGKVVECPLCGGWVDVPVIELGEAATAEQEYERQKAEYERQQEEGRKQLDEAGRQQRLSAQQLEHAQRQLERRELDDARWRELSNSFERLLARWDEIATQASRVLDKLDRG
ncbi:MAG: hypothetical protein U0929_02205 [Planctomycetaceae bacterium]